MTRITHRSSAPDTLDRGPDWRASALCHTEDHDPELWFPASYEGTTKLLKAEEAKTICRRCPVAVACLNFARTEHITSGIFGGLTEEERHPNYQPEPPQGTTPDSLEDAFRRRSAPADDGHRSWHGAPKLKWKGGVYNPLHVAFFMEHGRSPEGPVRRMCRYGGCYEGAHLTDSRIRDEAALCGTRSGYNRHRKRGERACPACRAANTAADKRWGRKAVAV